MPKVLRRRSVSFHPAFHGGAPGISLDPKVGSTFHPSSPTNPEVRVSPEYNSPFMRRRFIGSSRSRMVSGPPVARYKVKLRASVRTELPKGIAYGTRALPPDDFRAGGPPWTRHGCAGRTCEMVSRASTAKPSPKLDPKMKHKLLPVGAKALKSISERASRFFAPVSPTDKGRSGAIGLGLVDRGDFSGIASAVRTVSGRARLGLPPAMGQRQVRFLRAKAELIRRDTEARREAATRAQADAAARRRVLAQCEADCRKKV